jgi:hypothetical protein
MSLAFKSFGFFLKNSLTLSTINRSKVTDLPADSDICSSILKRSTGITVIFSILLVVLFVPGIRKLPAGSCVTDAWSALLTPGLSVNAEIKTGTRRVIEYVMSPLVRHGRESLHER